MSVSCSEGVAKPHWPPSHGCLSARTCGKRWPGQVRAGIEASFWRPLRDSFLWEIPVPRVSTRGYVLSCLRHLWTGLHDGFVLWARGFCPRSCLRHFAGGLQGPFVPRPVDPLKKLCLRQKLRVLLQPRQGRPEIARGKARGHACRRPGKHAPEG